MAPSLDPFGSATAMLAALRDRQLSAVELLDLHLARIARYNPVLNAIVTLDAQGAHAAAAAADATRRRGEDAPLLGLPFTTKDTNDVAGMRTTVGVAAFADRVPTADAPVIARARAAGAVILGKTNVPPSPAISSRTIPSSGERITRGILTAHQAGAPGAERRHWRRG